MTIKLRNIPVSFLIRRSVRYLLVSHGFRLLQAVVVFAALRFVLTGSRIAAIDQYGLQLSARESAEKTTAKVLEWQGQASQHDDVTLIVAKVK